MAKTATKGEAFDKNGRPIFPGDAVRSFHYRDRATRRNMYLLHVACQRGEGFLELVPACYLDPSTKDTGGRCWLLCGNNEGLEIVYENDKYSEERDELNRRIRKIRRSTEVVQ